MTAVDTLALDAVDQAHPADIVEYLEPEPDWSGLPPWRRAIPWIAVLGPFAVALGASLGYAVDSATLSPWQPPTLPIAAPAGLAPMPLAPVGVDPGVVAPPAPARPAPTPRPRLLVAAAPTAAPAPTVAVATTTAAPTSQRAAVTVAPRPSGTVTPAPTADPTATATASASGTASATATATGQATPGKG